MSQSCALCSPFLESMSVIGILRHLASKSLLFGYDCIRRMKNKRLANTSYGRLKAVGAGLVLAAIGSLRLLGGVQVVTHWTGQPMFSWGLIAAGIVCLLSALVPVSWVNKATETEPQSGSSHNMASVKPPKTSQKPGIGLFTYEQEKYTTPFQYFGQIVVGVVVVSLGTMLGCDQFLSLSRRSTGGIVTSAVLIVIGIFFAHAGVIFWFRRILRKP